MNLILIDRWGIIGSNDPYRAPELQQFSLRGDVYNHPNFFDGESARTSYIVGRRGQCVVTYSGSKYILGHPDEAYEKRFPNARERVLKNLNEIY
jgi:hypothetical protein